MAERSLAEQQLSAKYFRARGRVESSAVRSVSGSCFRIRGSPPLISTLMPASLETLLQEQGAVQITLGPFFNAHEKYWSKALSTTKIEEFIAVEMPNLVGLGQDQIQFILREEYVTALKNVIALRTNSDHVLSPPPPFPPPKPDANAMLVDREPPSVKDLELSDIEQAALSKPAVCRGAQIVGHPGIGTGFESSSFTPCAY